MLFNTNLFHLKLSFKITDSIVPDRTNYTGTGTGQGRDRDGTGPGQS